MKDFISVLKIFMLDWVTLILMYLSGSLIAKIDTTKSLDLIYYLSPENKVDNTSQIMTGVYIYLFISLSIVILISYLLNKSIFKVSKRSFIISQILFVLSFPLVLYLIAPFVGIY